MTQVLLLAISSQVWLPDCCCDLNLDSERRQLAMVELILPIVACHYCIFLFLVLQCIIIVLTFLANKFSFSSCILYIGTGHYDDMDHMLASVLRWVPAQAPQTTTIFICHRWLETRRTWAHQSWFQKEIENYYNNNINVRNTEYISTYNS